jgi:hypothetical protein
VTGVATGAGAERDLELTGVYRGGYKVPAAIAPLISRRASEAGIETMSLVLHLPEYAQSEEDHAGYLRLMQALTPMYGLPLEEADIEKAEEQWREVSLRIEDSPLLKALVLHLEGLYETWFEGRQEEGASLLPDVEEFLREMERRFRDEREVP